MTQKSSWSIWWLLHPMFSTKNMHCHLKLKKMNIMYILCVNIWHLLPDINYELSTVSLLKPQKLGSYFSVWFLKVFEIEKYTVHKWHSTNEDKQFCRITVMIYDFESLRFCTIVQKSVVYGTSKIISDMLIKILE